MTEAIQAIILNIFTTTSIQHIVVQINHTNLQSIKLPKNVGLNTKELFTNLQTMVQ